MTEKKIEDFLHLYLGCEVSTPDGTGWLASVERDRRKMDGLLLSNAVNVHFKKIIATKNSVDGYDRTRNYGRYLIKQESYVPLGAPDNTEPEFSIPGGIKPLLRPLSDMAEGEKTSICDELGIITSNCFTWIESALHGAILKFDTQVKFINSLRKRSFDVDGLIESGLALNATEYAHQ